MKVITGLSVWKETNRAEIAIGFSTSEKKNIIFILKGVLKNTFHYIALVSGSFLDSSLLSFFSFLSLPIALFA